MSKFFGYRAVLDPRELVYCSYCFEPLLYVYSHEKRRYCQECLDEISMENAREVLRDRRK